MIFKTDDIQRVIDALDEAKAQVAPELIDYLNLATVLLVFAPDEIEVPDDNALIARLLEQRGCFDTVRPF